MIQCKRVHKQVLSLLLLRNSYAFMLLGEVKKKPRRECIQDKAMCSPNGEEYLAWKRKIIEQAEAATSGHKPKKQRTR